MLQELRQHPFLFNLLSFHHFPGRKNPVCKICLESVHLVDFFSFPSSLLPPLEPAGSAQAVLISQRVSGSLDPTWPPKLSFCWCQHLAADWSVQFLNKAPVSALRGAHPLYFLKGPCTSWAAGCLGVFLSELFGFCSHFLTTLRLFSDRCHQPCAVNSFNPSKLWLGYSAQFVAAYCWMPCLVRISCHALFLSEWALCGGGTDSIMKPTHNLSSYHHCLSSLPS